MRVVINAHHMD